MPTKQRIAPSASNDDAYDNGDAIIIKLEYRQSIHAARRRRRAFKRRRASMNLSYDMIERHRMRYALMLIALLLTIEK